MSTVHPAPDGEFAQTRVLDVFRYAGFLCAHTGNEDATVQWWHLSTLAGADLGSTNRPELLGALIQHAR